MNVVIFTFLRKNRMSASVCIEQKGTVENISGHNILVKIHREVSCGQCHAKSMCYFGEGTERIIEISDFTPGTKIGDSVGIAISRSMGNKAIVLGYLLPFLLLISTLLILTSLGLREWISGILSMAMLVPYFVLLYVLRDRLRKTFTLSARKNEN